MAALFWTLAPSIEKLKLWTENQELFVCRSPIRSKTAKKELQNDFIHIFFNKYKNVYAVVWFTFTSILLLYVDSVALPLCHTRIKCIPIFYHFFLYYFGTLSHLPWSWWLLCGVHVIFTGSMNFKYFIHLWHSHFCCIFIFIGSSNSLSLLILLLFFYISSMQFSQLYEMWNVG